MQHGRRDSGLSFIRHDLKEELFVHGFDGFEIIYHLAGNPEVRAGTTNPAVHFNENIVSTFNLLEAIRKRGGLKSFVFASTSTVYGDASQIPTPEDYGPLMPISTYGASKLACESLVSAYANLCSFRAVICRLANVVGPRSNHGIICDFIRKLKANPSELEILGDGTQEKSYLHVSDCISGMVTCQEKSIDPVGVLNIGARDQTNVMKIADVVCQEMSLKKVKIKCVRATEDGRGWIGDVKFMKLDVSKLERLGWRSRMNSEMAVRTAARDILSEVESPLS